MKISSYPGGFATRSEIKQSVAWNLLYVVALMISSRNDVRHFERIKSVYLKRFANTVARRKDTVIARMSHILDPDGFDLDALWQDYLDLQIEDVWGRVRESYRSDWRVEIDSHGMDNLRAGLDAGNGVVLWGMSFCGMIVPKIALNRAGFPFVQLSAIDHGAAYPLTRFGHHVAGPTYRRPENRHIADRVLIPPDDNPVYKKSLVEALGMNKCVWITAERVKSKRPVSRGFLGHNALIPAGAPALAAKTGASLIPVFIKRTGRFQYHVEIESPVEMIGNSKQQQLESAVEDYVQRLEKRLLESPADWHWESAWVQNLFASKD